ncbi:MAG: SMI1/KNR4 family protein [Clostridia bacterium]|nr:SMI1/KNR4 family protein [Clostridia bacterium]
MNDTLKQQIKLHEKPNDFTHAIFDESLLNDTQNALGVKLPEQYIEFLINFGHDGIGGVETIGIGKNSQPIFVYETLDYRKYGLPDNLVIIENCDE